MLRDGCRRVVSILLRQPPTRNANIVLNKGRGWELSTYRIQDCAYQGRILEGISNAVKPEMA